jgi:hypothetical protein
MTNTSRIPRSVFALLSAAALAASSCRKASVDGEPRISFQTIDTLPGFGAVRVAPLSAAAIDSLRARPTAEWSRVLSVHAGDSTAVPMLGEFVIAHDTLRFVPRFPPLRGTRYVARFHGATIGKPSLSTEWTRPANTGPASTRVTAIYPSADTLPMNLLRMYIQFSAPMTIGEATHRVRLLDADGKPVPNAFLVAAGGQELWDSAHERITIFFDPGRIKRDLLPHEALGLPLRTGRSYALVVDSTWPDAEGRPLVAPQVKRFYVGAMDRTLPHVAAWRVMAPAPGTRAPLAIEFPESLDHALVARMIVVKRGADRVAGQVSVESHETRWSFTPDEPWRDADHVIEIDTELEDLAGNNLKHLFDVMPSDTSSRGVDDSVARLSFRPTRASHRTK